MSSVRDILLVTVLLFAIGLSVVLVVNLSHRINDNLLITPTINNTSEAVSVIQKADIAVNMSDYLYLALFIGFFISVMIFGYFVGGHPIMAPIYFFLVIIFTFVAIILQLVWGDVSLTSSLVSTVADLPITSFILSHIGYLTAVVGLVGIMAMFAKPAESI